MHQHESELFDNKQKPNLTNKLLKGSHRCGNCPLGFDGDGKTCIPTQSPSNMQCIDNSICNENAQCTQYQNNPPQCKCKSGFIGSGYGADGCIFIGRNPCDSIQCENGGVCITNGIAASCKCPPGTDPPLCKKSVDVCSEDFCLNGGNCTQNRLLGVACQCPEDFTGLRCEFQVQNCGGWRGTANGTLRYPLNSNSLYEHNARCEWRIKADRNKVLNITFTRFDFADSAYCTHSFLEVRFRIKKIQVLIFQFLQNS